MESCICNTLVAALLAVGNLAPSAPSTTPVQDECRSSAEAQRKASRLGANEDFFLHVVACLNDPSSNLPTCILDAKEDLHDELVLINKQYTKRLDACFLLGSGPYDPRIDPVEFSADVVNPYLPFVPGRTLVYESVSPQEVERVEVTTLNSTRSIGGVPCREVRDVVFKDGEREEDTIDWVSQHVSGDVWYLGELAMNYEDGFLEDLDGSWRYGKDNAKPGRLMLVAPSVGDRYRQEYLPNEAEDLARVISTAATVTVPAGVFTNCLETEEWTPIEPGLNHVERKYYALGVGLVLEVNVASGKRVELIEIRN